MRGRVLARVLSWSLDRGLVLANPCARGGRLYRGSRADRVWTADDEAAFLRHAPKHFHLPLLLALWTGQRQGDLLRLPWSAYDGTRIRLRQSKTGARVVIPVGAPLKAALDAACKAQHDHPHQQGGQAVDIGRVPRQLAHRLQRSRNNGNHFQ